MVAPSIWMMHSDWRPISRLLKGLTLTATFTLDICHREVEVKCWKRNNLDFLGNNQNIAMIL